MIGQTISHYRIVEKLGEGAHSDLSGERVWAEPGDRFEASIPKALFTTCDPVFWAEHYKSTYDAPARAAFPVQLSG